MGKIFEYSDTEYFCRTGRKGKHFFEVSTRYSFTRLHFIRVTQWYCKNPICIAHGVIVHRELRWWFR